MAKKRKSQKSSQSSLFRQLLYLLAVLIIILVAGLLGIDLTEEETDTVDAPAQTVAPVGSAGGTLQVFFTQPINSNDAARHSGSSVEQALIQQIDAAQQTIDAALFELNAPDATQALVRALERGVQVRIVFDDEHALEDPESTAQELIEAGAQFRSDERGAFMHNKYFIFDGQAVWTGSTNITRNGFYNNNNNAILVRSPELVANFRADFEEMYTDGAFTRTADTRSVVNRQVQLGDTLVETYFSPDDRDPVLARIVELVNSAQQSIRVMAFSFTLDEVGQAMLERLSAGVAVEGVIETTGSVTSASELPRLACAGGSFRQDGNPRIMHHKVIIIDDRIVLSGSFNFSNNAVESNSENMLIIHDPVVAAAYVAEFQARFAEGRVPPAEDLDC
ncbi:MAG: phospholipase [Anaerolineae bacterium]|nr:phospholipase [Anaerolineae bacterium]